MASESASPSRVAIAALLALLFAAAPARAAFDLPHDARERLDAMLAGEAPYTIERLDVGEIAVRFSNVWEGPDLRPGGVLRLHSPDPRLRFHTRSFAVHIDGVSETHLAPLVHAAHTIRARDDGSFSSTTRREDDPYLDGLEMLQRAVGVTWLVALALAFWCRFNVTVDVRVPHLLPAAIQVALFAYWSVYWRGVADFLPFLSLQVALAYALEAVFSFARSGYWRVGFAPVPVVLSANLFAWFEPAGMIALVTVAMASKAFLHRHGRHIFNPSAIGLSVAGLFFHFSGLFQSMNAAPNMSELVVLLALLPQLRFPIVPVSLGALLGLAVATALGSQVGDVVRAPALLAVALLATDPATIPRTPLGRLLFGILYGLGTGVFVPLLGVFHQPDDLGKVLAIPIANALVPRFDRIGTRVDPALLAPRWNPAHIVLWLFLITQHLAHGKARNFLAAHHWSYGTPLIRYGVDDVPRCDDNRMFCRPFTLLEETRMWAGDEWQDPATATAARFGAPAP